MKSKIFVVALLLIMLATMFIACNNAGDYTEVVANGNFETMKDSNVEGWTKSNGSVIEFKTDNDKQSDQYDALLGERYASISVSSSSEKYDYLFKTVKLEKNQLYKLSVYANVSAIKTSGDVGFYVGFAEDLNYSGINIKETGSDYQTYEVYFRSTTSDELTLTVGIGNAKSKSYGTVSFDNVSLMPVDNVPGDYAGTVKVLRTSADYTLSSAGSTTYVVLGAIATLVIAFACYMALRKFTQKENEFSVQNDEKKMSNKVFFSFVGAIIAGFVIRFLIMLFCYGMGSEIDDLASIALKLSANGVSTAFTDTAISNQPVGVMYILWAIGEIANAMGVESGSLGMSILIRMPMVIADLVILYLVFSFAFYEREEHKSGVVFGWIYAILPVFFTFSTMYGSFEVVATMFVVLTLISMLDKNYMACGIFYIFALLFSYYALLLLPVVVIFEVLAIVKDSKLISSAQADLAGKKLDDEQRAQLAGEIKTAKTNRMSVIVAMVVGFVLFYLASVPMCLSNLKQGNVFFVFKQMYAYFDTQALLSTDSFGLYAMFGLANSSSRNTLLDICNWLFVIGMGVFAFVAYFRSNNRADLILISSATIALYAILGAQSTIVLLPMACLLLLLYIIVVPDKRLYGVFTGLSVLSFLNIAELISRSGFLGNYLEASYLSFYSKSAFVIVFSVVAVVTAFYYAYVVSDICIYGNTKDIQPLSGSLKQELKQYASFTNTRKSIAKLIKK